MRTAALAILAVLASALGGMAQNAQPNQVLDEAVRRGFAEEGIDARRFTEMGLHKLSPAELNSLYAWHSNSVFLNQLEMVPKCPSFYDSPERPIRISFLVAANAPGGTDSAIMSNLLDRFRGIGDVEVASKLATASGNNAAEVEGYDLIAALTVIASELGERHIGYASSLEMLTPCTLAYPHLPGQAIMKVPLDVLFKIGGGGFVQTSPTLKGLTDSVYADLNTHALQELREDKRKARERRSAAQGAP